MNEGPLTLADFRALFLSVNDPSYAQPFIQNGDGRGLEVHGQAWAQFARVSQAADTTFQSMFVLPFSGQTDEPASGGRKSQVDVELTRAGIAYFRTTITLPAGTPISELAIDFGDAGGVETITGRRYLLKEAVTFLPGEVGPLVAPAEAEQVGRGYDNPLPGTINGLEQLGIGFTNAGASIVPGLTNHRLVFDPTPDVLSQQMIGSSVLLFGGANAGQIRRMVGYLDPQPFAMPPDGGTALLAATGIYRVAALAGTLQQGETIVQTSTGAAAVVIDSDGGYLVADRITAPNLLPGSPIVGQRSGAVVVLSSEDQSPDLVAETATTNWRLLGFAADFGITATNPLQPTGGRAAMLDELAGEDGIARATGEGDESLRLRASAPVDLVTPGAVLRAANRVLVPYGASADLHEIGQGDFLGFYYDGNASSTDPAIAFFYDDDFTARPQDRFKLVMSFLEMRAFFLIGIPPGNLGEFGFAYDEGFYNAYDDPPWLTFYDGFPLTSASIRQTIWAEVYRTKAAGVGFALVEDHPL